jgi:serine/threonine-protein kinase RsbW
MQKVNPNGCLCSRCAASRFATGRFLTHGPRACYILHLPERFLKPCFKKPNLPDGSWKGHTFVTEVTTELVLPTRIDSIAAAADAASEFLNQLGVGDEFAYCVDMALREAVTNAVVHGNKQDESKVVEVTLTNAAGTCEIKVRDHGQGFDPSGVADPTDARNLLKASGRGILFMRTFMDEVDWLQHDEGGTVVRMTKRL